MTIATTHYRYKRPPKRRKPLVDVPVIVTPANPKKGRRPALRGGQAAAKEEELSARSPAGEAQSSTASSGEHIPANDDRKPATSSHHGTKSAIVTATGRKQAKRLREQREADDVEVSPETKDLVDRMMFGRWPGNRQ